MERQKMPRSQRAKIFQPFTLIGLQEAIRLKEYEHEKIVMKNYQKIK